MLYCRYLIIFSVLDLAAFNAEAGFPASYTITDIGGYYGESINASGQVTGAYRTANQTLHAILYSNGHVQDLGTLGGDDSFGQDINDSGQITGRASTPSVPNGHAFLYSNGRMQDLDASGDQSFGRGINAKGQVTGYSFTPDDSIHAFLYNNGRMQDLGTLGGTDSFGQDINASGQVTGSSSTIGSTSDSEHAFLYSQGQMQDLGELGDGRDRSVGLALNDNGQVTGYSFTRGYDNEHAFLYSNGQMQDLGTLGGSLLGDIGLGYDQSFGLDINANGEVVGYSYTPSSEQHAFLYRDDQMFDLNTLIVANTGWTLTDATGINGSGQIIANGLNPDGESRAVLLTPSTTPVPLPAAFGLFGSALAAWQIVGRRRNKAKLLSFLGLQGSKTIISKATP
jgi:probable HAF family extracellular repeat protein